MNKKYLVLMASKGGVGKTSICKQLSRELYRIGHDVHHVDYDPQQHFAQFAEVNKHMFCTEDEAEFVVIDTQGAHTQTNSDVLECMKTEDALIIVPFRPTEDDYKETLKMKKRLHQAGVLDKAVFVINGAYRETDKDAKEFSSRLKDVVRMSKSLFTQRKAFSKEADSKVISEVSRFLHAEVFNQNKN